MKTSTSFLVIAAVFFLNTTFNSQHIKKRSTSPRFILGAVVNYNYVVGNANGNPSNFSIYPDESRGSAVFNSQNLGMQQGAGLSLFGKYAINRKRNLYLTGELGFNMFYNTQLEGANRTRWNIINLAPGIELNHKTTPRNKVFVGLQLHYSLIIGAWQTYVTFPDQSISNVYYRFKPSSRIGLSLGSGMEFKTGKKSFLVVGVRGTWANMLPKSNGSASEVYYVTVNDSQNSNGIKLDNSKEIIYMQLFTGMNFSIK